MNRKAIVLLALVCLLATAGSLFAQNINASAQAAAGVNTTAGNVPALAPQARHAVPTDLIDDDSTNSGPSSIAGNPGAVPGVVSVQNFSRSFTVGSTNFPFTMVGNDPSLGHRTEVPAKITAVSLQLLNADGTVFDTVDAGEFEQPILNSPIFQKFKYEQSGEPVQFADAIARAELFSSMDPNWHTVLNPAVVVDRLTFTVPKFVTVISRGKPVKALNYASGLTPDGHRFVLMLNLFFNQLLGTVVNTEIDANNITTSDININLFPNTFLFSFNRANPTGVGGCCTLGFHTYFTDLGTPEQRWVTVYASYISPGIFGAGFEDVTALSHEVAETFNDPFVNNITPVWQFPGEPGACQNNLETGDPVEVLENATFPVTLKNKGVPFTFHPQTEALLQWFAQTVPSDAIHGAYSYPDLTALTAPATLCH